VGKDIRKIWFKIWCQTTIILEDGAFDKSEKKNKSFTNLTNNYLLPVPDRRLTFASAFSYKKL
jgi:hypothetical protein